MAARRSARNAPMLKEAQEGVKGGTLAGGSPFCARAPRAQFFLLAGGTRLYVADLF